MTRRADRRRSSKLANVVAEGIIVPSARRRGRRIGLVVLVVSAVAAAGAAWWVTSRPGGPPSLADPQTVDLPPPPSSVEPVRAYVTGPGHPLLAMLDLDRLTTGSAAGAPSAQACRALAPQLAEVAEPRALRVLAERIPDGPTADMATGYVDSLVRFLTSCAQGASVGRDDLAFRATVLERRFEQLGIG